MSSTTNQDDRFENLRADYKGAFDEWALQVSNLQTVSQSAPDSDVFKEAEGRVEAAQIAYRDSRDRLADDLGIGSSENEPKSI